MQACCQSRDLSISTAKIIIYFRLSIVDRMLFPLKNNSIDVKRCETLKNLWNALDYRSLNSLQTVSSQSTLASVWMHTNTQFSTRSEEFSKINLLQPTDCWLSSSEIESKTFLFSFVSHFDSTLVVVASVRFGFFKPEVWFINMPNLILGELISRFSTQILIAKIHKRTVPVCMHRQYRSLFRAGSSFGEGFFLLMRMDRRNVYWMMRLKNFFRNSRIAVFD